MNTAIGLGALIAAAIVAPASAATDIYVKLYDANHNLVNGGASGGPATTDGSIKVDDFALSFGRTYTPGTGGGTLGPLTFSPVTIDGDVGTQSPALVAGDLTQQRFYSMAIEVYRSAGGATPPTQPFVVWTISHPIVSSYATDAANTPAGETYQFDDYFAIQYKYTAFKPDGSTQGTYTQSWNRLTNAPGYTADAAVVVGEVSDFQFITSLAAVPEPTAAVAIVVAGYASSIRRRRSARVAG